MTFYHAVYNIDAGHNEETTSMSSEGNTGVKKLNIQLDIKTRATNPGLARCEE